MPSDNTGTEWYQVEKHEPVWTQTPLWKGQGYHLHTANQLLSSASSSDGRRKEPWNPPSLSPTASGTNSSSHPDEGQSGTQMKRARSTFSGKLHGSHYQKSAFNMGCEGVTPNKKASKKSLLLGASLAAWSHLTRPENKDLRALDRAQSHRGQFWRWQAASPLRTIPSFFLANRQKKRGVEVMYSVSSNTGLHRCSIPVSPGRRFALNPGPPTNPTPSAVKDAGPIIPGCICGWASPPSYRKSNHGVVQPFPHVWYRTLE